MSIAASLFSLSYALAAIAYALLLMLTLLRPLHSKLGRWFAAAVAATSIVFGLAAASNWFPNLGFLRPLDSLPLVTWTIFTLVAIWKDYPKRMTRLLLITLLGAWLLDVCVQAQLLTFSDEYRFLPRTIVAVVALVSAEQLIRSAPAARRWSLKHFTVAIYACAGFDLLLFAHALVTGAVSGTLLVSRGFVWAFACPLFALSAVRNPSWDVPIHVSREIAFHSASAVVTGFFLLALGTMGYLVANAGLAWGDQLQVVVVIGGLLLFATLAVSRTFRSRIRRFVDNNFYSYRFDYRHEWLRFTEALSSSTRSNVYETVANAFGTVCDSPGVALYTWSEQGKFDLRYEHGLPTLERLLNHEIVGNATKPIDVQSTHEGATAKRFPIGTKARFLIPLLIAGKPIGAIVVAEPRSELALDNEVSDLLQAAAMQAAIFIQQAVATEELVVARQFDSFNRMSAFVVHDLKNLAAQLSLLTTNAQTHRDNPAFQADMLETIAHVTNRMRSLLSQLANGASAEPATVVNAVDCVQAALLSKPALHHRTALIVECDEAPRVLASAQRLERIIGHIIQNADEAMTEGAGTVKIVVKQVGQLASVSIQDSGIGMSDAFIRDELFKPFVSTKQAGMGIGMYESANYMKSLNGSIRVESEVGKGTSFTLMIPLASASSIRP